MRLTVLSGKLYLENMHVKRVCLSTQRQSLVDKDDKVYAVKCDFYVFVLYRTHLIFLPIVVISNLCITIYY